MKTTKTILNELKEAKLAADKAYYEYRKAYNKEHKVERGTIIKEIIQLHKKGFSNKEIVEAGYNKGTVNRQVMLYKKGKKVEKTTIRQYLPQLKKVA